MKNFAVSMDMNTDSISANTIYLAVKDEWNHIQALYTDEELELLREIN